MPEVVEKASAAGAVAYTVRLQPSGVTFEVGERESILTAGLNAGVRLAFGCRAGVCGDCRSKIVDGVVDLGLAHPAVLTPQQRAEGCALLCVARAKSDLVIEAKEVPVRAESGPCPMLVRTVTHPTSNVAIITGRLATKGRFEYLPGQHLSLILPDGSERDYALAAPPLGEQAVKTIELHVQRVPGGLFSDQGLAALKPLQKFEVRGPRGEFFLRPSDKPLLLIAEGIGYAPIRAILMAAREDPNRKIFLYWLGESALEFYAADELRLMSEQTPSFAFAPVVRPRQPGNVDGVAAALKANASSLADFQAYVAGRPATIPLLRDLLVDELGLCAEDLFAQAMSSTID